jgi:hypothetical protein
MANTRNELHDARSMAIAGVCIFLAPTGFFPAQASSIDGIYAFGDSLTDVGNVYAATGGVTPAAAYWVDSTSGALNDIEIRGGTVLTTAGGAVLPVGFVCRAPVTPGSFAIPPSILMALPAGTGTLSVAHIFNAIYPANGPLDLFQRPAAWWSLRT